MRIQFLLLLFFIAIASCNSSVENSQSSALPVKGTWKLLTGTLIEKGDTTVTDYTSGKEFIKIINDTHFAFFGHDLTKGSDSTAFFTSGGGTYSLHGSSYTENLLYCNDRQWEKNSFHFTVSIHNDTLIQQGIEKIDSLGVNRINTEKYIRLKER